MVDIIKTAKTQTAAQRVPGLDWQLVNGGADELKHHDLLQPCRQTNAHIERVDVRDMMPELGLDTAVLISLFSDRRAGQDDTLPAGVTDPRGWVGDVLEADDDAIGSGLWLGYYTKTTREWAEYMQFAAQESLAWMLRDRVAEVVNVNTNWHSDSKLAITISITRPDDLEPVYQSVWAFTLHQHGGSHGV